MKFKIFSLFLVAFFMASCASPKLIITNQKTGVSGTGTATGATFNSLGTIELNADGEEYSGSWVAMRDSGSATLSFWSPGPKDSGVGIANLTTATGKPMRCEFGYSLTSMSGIGLCKTKAGGTYDLMMQLM
ncbi:hypothetical protein EYC08_07770 [Tabrizicola sp. WMC-M-20]|nr:hypothetical protein EYC08_07770 [Tabrizicola sp. WMC-M-20]